MKATTVWMWVEPYQKWGGDEGEQIMVAQCDDDGDPVGTMHLCDNSEVAWDLAEALAGDALEIINDLPAGF